MIDIFYMNNKLMMQFSFYLLLFFTLLTLGFYFTDRKTHKIKYLVLGNVSYFLMHFSVLYSINYSVKLVAFVAFFDLLGISLYVVAFANILNIKIRVKTFIVINIVHLLIVFGILSFTDQVSLIRAVTSAFNLIIVALVIESTFKSEGLKTVKSFYNVIVNMTFYVLYRFALIITRIYTTSIEVDVNSINSSITTFTFLLILLIIWINFSLLFVNYDLLNSNYRHLSYYDHLTNIPNRRFAQIKINQAIVDAKEKDQIYGILMLDLDAFKSFNDQYGHDFGDEVLIEFVKEVQKLKRVDDLLSRYGGDEFLILLRMQKHEEMTYFLNRINTYFERHSITKKNVKVSFSIGKLMIDKEITLSSSEILKRVDEILYTNKELGSRKNKN